MDLSAGDFGAAGGRSRYVYRVIACPAGRLLIADSFFLYSYLLEAQLEGIGMNWSRSIVVTAVVGICGFAIAQSDEKPMTKWDEAAAAEATVFVEKGLETLATFDIKGFESMLASEMDAYDLDIDGKSVKMQGKPAGLRYAESIVAAAKSMGATGKLVNRTVKCRATSTMAYCSCEYDFVVTPAEGTPIVQPTRTTVVLVKEADGWKWQHWHSSLSAPASTPTAPAAK